MERSRNIRRVFPRSAERATGDSFRGLGERSRHPADPAARRKIAGLAWEADGRTLDLARENLPVIRIDTTLAPAIASQID